MVSSHSKRLFDLAQRYSQDKNFVEFIELYGILITEQEMYDVLKGLNSLKNFIIGFNIPQNVDKEV